MSAWEQREDHKCKTPWFCEFYYSYPTSLFSVLLSHGSPSPKETDNGWRSPVGLNLALEAGTGGFRLCPEWLTNLSSACRAQGCVVLCFWALGSVLRTMWLQERKQVDTMWAGGSAGSPTPSEALEAIAPFGEWPKTQCVVKNQRVCFGR